LEAVRVSRAGYAARYSEKQFAFRYYILGPQQCSLGELVEKISFDIWETDLAKERALEKAREAKATAAARKSWVTVSNAVTSTTRPRHRRKSSFGALCDALGINGKINDGAVATLETTDEEAGGGNLVPLLADTALSPPPYKGVERIKNGIAVPGTPAEFRALNVSSQCALAGIQVGKTKIFLKREALDLLEGMRVDAFYGAASRIQGLFRMDRDRTVYKRKKMKVVRLQDFFRKILSKNTHHPWSQWMGILTKITVLRKVAIRDRVFRVISMVSAILMWSMYTFDPWRSRELWRYRDPWRTRSSWRSRDRGGLRGAADDEITGMLEDPKHLVNSDPPVRNLPKLVDDAFDEML